MTVAELIELLKKHPPGMTVLLPARDMGYDTINYVEEAHLFHEPTGVAVFGDWSVLSSAGASPDAEACLVIEPLVTTSAGG